MTQDLPPFDQIEDDFAFIDDWDEKYRYIIDLGRRLPPLKEEEYREETRVRGCASQVWLVFDHEGQAIRIRGDSDAAIVKGLIGIVLSLFSGKTAGEITAIDTEAKLKALDLQEHITPQRSNGLASMIKRIKAEGTA